MILLPDSSFFAISEKGGREVNEDSILARSIGEHFIFGVADGLGGHARGEVASRMAIAELERIDAAALSSSDPEFLLLQVFAEANMQIGPV